MLVLKITVNFLIGFLNDLKTTISFVSYTYLDKRDSSDMSS